MMLNIIFTFQAESQWNYFVISKLAQVQTSHFTSAKSNANEQEQQIDFSSLALNSAHVKCDVWTGPKM